MTRRAIAKIFGTSDRTIGRLADAGIVPRQKDGQFDLKEVLPMLFRRLQIAETILNRFAPGELDDRFRASME